MDEVIFLPCIFLFVGFVFFLIGSLVLWTGNKRKRNSVLINSFICDIQTGRSLDPEEISCQYVYVTYVFNGMQYVKNILYTKKGMKVGDLVPLYCNPYNPNKVWPKGMNWFPLIFMGIGILTMSVGIFVGLLMFLIL